MPTSTARQPKFFIDRSLGGVIVPATLRQAGWDVITIGEFYGEQRAQRVHDTEWLAVAGDHGWPVLLRDPTVLHRHDELAALTAHRVQAFCLMHRHLVGEEQARWLLAHERRIMNVVGSRPGPYMYGIFSTTRIEELWRPDRETRRQLKRDRPNR